MFTWDKDKKIAFAPCKWTLSSYVEENGSPRGRQVPHQKWISGRMQHIHLHQVQIKLPTLILKPEETSPEVQNRGINGHTKRTYVLPKFKKKRNPKYAPIQTYPCFVICWSFHVSSSSSSKYALFISLFFSSCGMKFSMIKILKNRISNKCISVYLICTAHLHRFVDIKIKQIAKTVVYNYFLDFQTEYWLFTTQ